MISDYTCCPDEEKTDEFWAYLADRKYDLRPADEYLKFITGEIMNFDKSLNDSQMLVLMLEKKIKRNGSPKF